jgi:hypothetical protein
MNDLSLQELRDLLSAIRSDSQGTHGDARSLRIDALENKLNNAIWKATR